MSKKTVRFMCTAFRDGFQSVYGARVFTKDFLPAVEAACDAGINWFEAGGGARFQSLYFYCNEDAFEMMDQFRAVTGPEADLQTLGRGVNVVGLESQSSDIIKLHADLFAKHGISSIRNFDALNDVNNLVYSGQCIVDAGLNHQICITMMELPPGCSGAHTPEFYMDRLQQILDSGVHFDSLCFKDASGTSVPAKVYETVKRARKMLPGDVSIHFHGHETAGIGAMCYRAAIEAGADAIDLSMAPVSGGTCQTDIAVMWHALRDTEYTLDVDIDKVMKAEEVFKDCMKDYFLPPEATRVEPLIAWSPMPGGALTANTQMLRDNGLMHRYNEMIAAMGEVVRLGGFGTSVTPVSQFYFQQAFNNVIFGPWSKIAEGYGKMVLGYFGKTPVPPDPEVVKVASEQLKLEPTDKTPLEINDADPTKGVAVATKMLEEAKLPVTDENIFITSTCKEKGIAFLQGHAKIGVRKNVTQEEPAVVDSNEPEGYTITIGGRNYSVMIQGGQATVDGQVYKLDYKLGMGDTSKTAKPADSLEAKPVQAPMPGLVLRIEKKAGDRVNEGETILVLEAMKMEVSVTSPATGEVSALKVSQGDQVNSGQVLAQVS